MGRVIASLEHGSARQGLAAVWPGLAWLWLAQRAVRPHAPTPLAVSLRSHVGVCWQLLKCAARMPQHAASVAAPLLRAAAACPLSRQRGQHSRAQAVPLGPGAPVLLWCLGCGRGATGRAGQRQQALEHVQLRGVACATGRTVSAWGGQRGSEGASSGGMRQGPRRSQVPTTAGPAGSASQILAMRQTTLSAN